MLKGTSPSDYLVAFSSGAARFRLPFNSRFWEVLSGFPSVFAPSGPSLEPMAHRATGPHIPGTDGVTLAGPLQGAPLEERTAAVQDVLVHLRDARGLVPGWRDEVGVTVARKPALPCHCTEQYSCQK